MLVFLRMHACIACSSVVLPRNLGVNIVDTRTRLRTTLGAETLLRAGEASRTCRNKVRHTSASCSFPQLVPAARAFLFIQHISL